jgi:Predicted Fe-S oxidoreductases
MEVRNMIVSWNTTNACNMYCDHCYRDAGCKAEEELSTAEAKTMLEQIVKAGFKIMIFSGGEPLMRPDIIELVAYAKSLGLRPVFGTNGTLLTVEMAKRLKEAGAHGHGNLPGLPGHETNMPASGVTKTPGKKRSRACATAGKSVCLSRSTRPSWNGIPASWKT